MTVVAAWPPGMTAAWLYSTFEPRAGNEASGISVSVAFSPTPTRSTIDGSVIDFIVRGRSGKLCGLPQSPPADHGGSHQYESENSHPGHVHTQIWHARLEPEPDKHADRARKNDVIPPVAAFCGFNGGAAVGAEHANIVQTISIALSQQGIIGRGMFALSCYSRAYRQCANNHHHGTC